MCRRSIHQPIATLQMAQLKGSPAARLSKATPNMKRKTKTLNRKQFTMLNSRLKLRLTPRRPRISSRNSRVTMRRHRRNSQHPLITRRQNNRRKNSRSSRTRQGRPFTRIRPNIRMITSMSTPQRTFQLKRIISITLLRHLMLNILPLTRANFNNLNTNLTIRQGRQASANNLDLLRLQNEATFFLEEVNNLLQNLLGEGLNLFFFLGQVPYRTLELQ